jgi:hypothetical protein
MNPYRPPNSKPPLGRPLRDSDAVFVALGVIVIALLLLWT